MTSPKGKTSLPTDDGAEHPAMPPRADTTGSMPKPRAGWNFGRSQPRRGSLHHQTQGGAGAPDSPGIPSHSGRVLARSVTIEPHLPSSNAMRRASDKRSSRSSWHPGAAANSSGFGGGDSSIMSDLERAGIPPANPLSQSALNLEGRSYRFQAGGADHSALPRSYTATSDTIRDSTARLAGMALMSDDESSNSGSRIDIIPEDDRDEDDEATSPARPFGIPAAQAGPSNLSRVLGGGNGLTSHSVSPATLKAQSQNVSPQEPSSPTPRVAASPPIAKLGLRSPEPLQPQPAPETDYSTDEGGDEMPRGEPNENTGLLSRGRERPRTELRGRRSSSAVRRRTEESSAFSQITQGSDVDGIGSDSGRDRTVFGYGALAQASQAAGGGSSFHVAEDGGDDEMDHGESNGHHLDGEHEGAEESQLPLLWALVPTKYRPGGGQRKVKVPSPSAYVRSKAAQARKVTWHDVATASMEPVRLLPAVILGMLLNVLDGVSYGLIIFPSAYPIFSSLGGDGVSMFFVTTVISQLIYSLGGSIFRGGNGSMMIEVVPFYHILVNIIIDELGDENPRAVLATTMVAFALSSIFAGIVFLLLGYFRLGVLIGFFPRHILVGCIGGVGVFLIETGLEVTGQLRSEDGFQWNLETLRYFTQSWSMVAHWLPALLLAVLLRVVTHRWHHPLIFPGFFLAIPVVFYAIAKGALHLPLDTLRKDMWVFDIGDAGNAPFWRFYTYFDFRQTSGQALIATLPTQLALTFFSILHVPLNVPALAVSIGEDNLDTDRELVAHGFSNILAGLAGTTPNYLCYVNSVLFYRVGGGSTLSGLMLAAGTFVILLAGPGAIGYLPIVVVGALIFVLGLDLTKEAVWDTLGRVNRWEYFTIWVIIGVMTYYDFVVGILVGIILACLFFVIQTSRRRTVRAVLDGTVARSTVRRHTTQRQFLEAVGSQTQIVKLQGFLYFATIGQVEALIRRALDIASWQRNPIRFLVVDFSLVSGVDFSAAEAFTRVQRLLDAKDVLLVFCGLTPDSDVGKALRSVDMWADRGIRLEVFASLNEALEWTENEYLRGMYFSSLAVGKQLSQASMGGGGAALDVPDKKRQPAFAIDETTFENSPRQQHLHRAARHATETSRAAPLGQLERKGAARQAQPVPLLLITFQAYMSEGMDESIFVRLAKYFTSMHLPRGEVLWDRGSEPDGMYLIESGILKVRYSFEQEGYDLHEAVLPGTIAGELSFLSSQQRGTTAYADLDCVLWKLSADSIALLQQELPAVHAALLQLLLRAATEEQEGLLSYLVSRLS